MKRLPETIAIDGPAASGKSTIARRLAAELGYLFFDTGVMYRAVTWAALEADLPPADAQAMTALAERIQIDVRPPSLADGRLVDVLVDGRDVSWEIRSPVVEGQVSAISAHPGVRTAMTAQQRRIGLRGQVVMVGRDIGTVVLPDAPLKIYLDASAEERARRRTNELVQRGETADYDEILSTLKRRDHIDSTREVAPLRPAEDAIRIDTDHLDPEQVLAAIHACLKQWAEQAA